MVYKKKRMVSLFIVIASANVFLPLYPGVGSGAGAVGLTAGNIHSSNRSSTSEDYPEGFAAVSERSKRLGFHLETQNARLASGPQPTSGVGSGLRRATSLQSVPGGVLHTADVPEAGAADQSTFSVGQLDLAGDSGNPGAPVDGTPTSATGATGQPGGIPSDPDDPKRKSKKRNPAILFPLTAAGAGAGLILIGDTPQLNRFTPFQSSTSTPLTSPTSTPLTSSTQSGVIQAGNPSLPQPVPEPAFYQLGSLFLMGGFYFGKRHIRWNHKDKSTV